MLASLLRRFPPSLRPPSSPVEASTAPGWNVLPPPPPHDTTAVADEPAIPRMHNQRPTSRISIARTPNSNLAHNYARKIQPEQCRLDTSRPRPLEGLGLPLASMPSPGFSPSSP